MLRLIALALLLTSLFAVPVRAQNVRRDSLNGWGLNLRAFDRAADDAGRVDWPSTREGRPGTRVQITFDSKNADVTLAAPLAFGSDRLLAEARKVAAELNLPKADFILVDTRRTAIVDIELNHYLQRRRWDSRFDLDLSALARALGRVNVPQPVVIGVERDEATTLTAGGTPHTLEKGAWFAAPAEVLPGSRLAYRARVSWRVIPGLLLFGIAPLGIAVWMGITARKRTVQPVQPERPSPDEVQRRYDRQAPAWVSTAGFTFVPLVLLFLSDPARMAKEIDLLIPGGMLGLCAPSCLVLFATMALRIRRARTQLGERSERDTATCEIGMRPDPEDLPAFWDRFGPLGVLALGMFTAPVFVLVPVYTPQGQLWLRNGGLTWIALTLVAAALLAWRGKRAGRSELKGGPWFEMVAELAARAKVPVRHVVVFRSPSANAYASIWGTVGLSTSLLRQLDRDEVEAVVAHELGHLKLKHPHRTLAVSLISMAIFWAGWWGLRSMLLPSTNEQLRVLLNTPILLIFVLPMFQMLLISRGMRAREEQADRLAVEWIGDRELVVRAIERIHTLNQAPSRLKPSDEALSTHPSLVHRVEAIRREG